MLTHTAHRNDLDGFFVDNSGWTTNTTNVTAGVQLGYDWQCGVGLFGLVADWDWTNAHKKLAVDPNAIGTNIFVKSEAHWFSTIRARLGVTACDVLFYVTGGGAVSHFHTQWDNLTVNTPIGSFKNNEHRWGWVAGAGTEVLLGCNWSFGAEVLFLHFNERSKNHTFLIGTTAPVPITFGFGHSDSIWVARALLNFRFGNLFW